MEKNIATENKKVFTSIDKNLLLNAGRTIGRTFWLKKDKYTQEINKIETDFTAAQDEELQKMIEEFRTKSAAKLEKKLAALKGKVAAIDAEQALWEKIIIEKTGYRAEEIFDFEITTSETGKRSVKASFKYPEVIPPVEIEHEGVHYALNTDGDVIEPECPTHEFGSDFDKDKEVLADEEREAMEQQWAEEKAQADQMIEAFAGETDAAINAVANPEGDDEDPFFVD